MTHNAQLYMNVVFIIVPLNKMTVINPAEEIVKLILLSQETNKQTVWLEAVVSRISFHKLQLPSVFRNTYIQQSLAYLVLY